MLNLKKLVQKQRKFLRGSISHASKGFLCHKSAAKEKHMSLYGIPFGDRILFQNLGMQPHQKECPNYMLSWCKILEASPKLGIEVTYINVLIWN